MALNPLLQWLVANAQTAKATTQINNQVKAKNALWWLTNVVKKTMPKARAKALLPWLVKTTETTGAIWQANVAKQQAQAKALLPWLTNTAIDTANVVKWQAQEKQTNAIGELWSTILANPESQPSEIKAKFPEFAQLDEQVFWELWATILANPNISMEEIRVKFPELDQTKKPESNIWSNISDVIWWAYRSVVDIPQSITESWILDKPAEYLAKWPVWEAIRSWAKSLFWEKALKEYQAKEWWKKFSEVAKTMTVGNPNSKLYQWTRVAWDVLQTWIWVAQAAKSIAKSGTKKAVLNMLKEADTVWGKRAALSRWGLDTQWPLSKFLKWSKDLVKPSKRTLEATDEVVNTIKWASKNPQKLYTQISTKISDIWSDLSSKLKTIGIKWSNLSTKELNTKLVDLSNEIKDISPTMWKKLQVLSKNITNSADADEFRKSLQQLDDMIPENVKSWINLSWKDQYIYDAWRAARWAGNDLLDNIANNIPDAAVKKSFKSMSNLYHAKWQISQNIWRLTPKVTWIWTKLARAWKWLAGTVVAGKVLQELWVFD